MILNKKGLMMLPLVALLFTSCSPWKGVDYKTAKEFIDTNYRLDGATAKLPTKVHETFKCNAVDENSADAVVGIAMFAFYSVTGLENIKWTEEAPYKGECNADYIPSEEQMFDFPISPIVSEGPETAADILTPSNPDEDLTASYAIDGKKFKQDLSTKMYEVIKCNGSYVYNEKGYRSEVTFNCSGKGEIVNLGGKITVDFSFNYHGVYTYAE